MADGGDSIWVIGVKGAKCEVLRMIEKMSEECPKICYFDMLV